MRINSQLVAARWSHRGLRAWSWLSGGSFVAITGVGKSSWPAGLPVAEACLCSGHGGVSSPVSLRRLGVIARVGGGPRVVGGWCRHAGERRVNGASVVIGLGCIEQLARYISADGWHVSVFIFLPILLWYVSVTYRALPVLIRIWYGIQILPHVSMHRRITLCTFLHHYCTWILRVDLVTELLFVWK